MVDVICKAIEGLGTTAVSSEACLGALAAIRAAKLQASATTLAGWLTLTAGAGALLAGILAYTSQILMLNLQRKELSYQQKLVLNSSIRQFKIKLDFVTLEIAKSSIEISRMSHAGEQTSFSKRLSYTSHFITEYVPIAWDEIEPLGVVSEIVDKLYESLRMAVAVVSLIDLADRTDELKEHILREDSPETKRSHTSMNLTVCRRL